MEQETRIDKKKFYDLIIETLKDKTMTAYEVSVVLKEKGFIPLATRQAVQPRMTELKEKGVLEEMGKKFDHNTRKYVTCYALYIYKDKCYQCFGAANDDCKDCKYK